MKGKRGFYRRIGSDLGCRNKKITKISEKHRTSSYYYHPNEIPSLSHPHAPHDPSQLWNGFCRICGCIYESSPVRDVIYGYT